MVSDEMGRRLVDGKDPTRCRPAPRSHSKLCDRSFDMATGFNGIWNWCGVALSEAHRVLVPSGRLGLPSGVDMTTSALLPPQGHRVASTRS
jgi:hypothetical protein